MQYRSLHVPSCQDKIVLHVQEWGSGPQVCIMIHGFGQGAYAWSEIAPFLEPPYRALAVDLRGHGDSTWDQAGRYHAHDHATDVVQLIDRLGLDRFVLIGHSLGGDVAIRVAAMRPSSVLRIVLVDFGLDLDQIGMAQVRSDFSASLRSYDSLDAYVAWLAERRPLITSGLLRFYAAQALRAQADGTFRLKCDPALADAPRKSTAFPPLRNALETVCCPVLLVRGVASAILSRAAAERTARMLHNCAMRTVDAAGHAVMMDNPAEFVTVIRPFLQVDQHPPFAVERSSDRAPGLTAE